MNPKLSKTLLSVFFIGLCGCSISRQALAMLGEQPPNFRRSVLTHELSHFHLQQHLGSYNYGSNLPAWFQEGLAEYVSGGASMEGINDAEAEKAILAGRHFVPETTGSFLFPKRWSTYALKPNMFYRQSFLFVSYLKHIDEPKFRAFMLALENGAGFADSFNSTFGLTMDVAWQQFVAQLKADEKLNNKSAQQSNHY